ncbi:MAG TPA: DNA-3-methyladenine glycosylase 2 family protein [Clostridiales bacterium]|nr:DNA-3-methyladenine glycosylase 2 family protein [Clostridiales bacterium]
MDYKIYNDKIIIKDLEDFSLDHIFECGQVFRYQKYKEKYEIISKDKFCVLFLHNDCVIISSTDPVYFENYFDLQNDYRAIKEKLSKFSFMRDAINFAGGLRILRQDLEEALISFIISANNNIPRIKKIINLLCDKKGKDYGNYRAFPTAYELRDCTEDFFKEIGAGYRARYLVDTIKELNSGFDLERLRNLDTELARKELLKLKGVGRKVADCVLLFGYHKTDCFPTDTWIEKVFMDVFNKEGYSANQKASFLSEYFADLSGYAQQYLFYHARETYNKNKI